MPLCMYREFNGPVSKWNSPFFHSIHQSEDKNHNIWYLPFRIILCRVFNIHNFGAACDAGSDNISFAEPLAPNMAIAHRD